MVTLSSPRPPKIAAGPPFFVAERRGSALIWIPAFAGMTSVFLILCFFASPTICEASARREGLVHWVVDGDTFELETGERVRFIGIDTPEYQPWKGRIDFYGKEASEFSKKYLNHKKVILESDVQDKDKYGRTLAYVYLENGEFVNKVLVDEGYARAKYYRPNGRFRELFKEAEQNAKKNHKGMWATTS